MNHSLNVANFRYFRRGILIAFGFGLLFSACGQGNEPIANLGDPSQSNGPGLTFPIILSSFTFTGFTPFTATTGSWGLTSASYTSSIQVHAPGAGFVMTADTGSDTISIIHTPHIYTKIVGAIPSGITPGSYVSASQVVGTASSSSSTIYFSVYADGVSVCPLSYLSAAGRTSFIQYIYNSYSYTLSPCD